MLRRLFILIMVFSWTAITAQETPNMMVVHQSNSEVQYLYLQDIDCIDLPHSFSVHFKSGSTQQIPFESIAFFEFSSDPHEAIDLGLSVKWATCNIGASLPEEYGGLFSWGETIEKDDYSEDSYAFFSNEQYDYIGVNICGTKYDVARTQWGGLWRLPTRSEIQELTSRCTWTAETLNDVQGYRVTGPNGNSIFLPSAGYQNGGSRTETGTGGFYWSGTLDRDMPSAAYNINFRGYDAEWSASRAYGFSVRAVR